MKSKSFMLMILSMGFGLIAAIGISQVMGRNNSPTVKAPKMGPVLVSADHLDHKALLTEENVHIENWPVDIIPENAATKIEEIKDMAIRTRLSKGLPIMQQDLINKLDINTLAIPDGFKVVAIKVAEDDTIAGLLNPGDKVDVIGLFKQKNKDGDTRSYSKTFLKALRVFSVNSQMTASQGTRTETSTRGSAIVGVLVNERQSEAIVYVQKTGQLKLVLRGDYVEGDNDQEDLLAIGMENEEPSAEAENADGKTKLQPFGSIEKQCDDIYMIIWNGSEPEKVTFENGALPPTSYRQPTKPNEESSQAKPNDEADPDSFKESDRGLEEDQYQGE